MLIINVVRKDDNDCVKRCITWEVEGIRHPKKTWWDCVKNDMKSLGLSQKDAQSRSKWRRIKGGNRLTQVHLEKWPLKRSVCAYNKVESLGCLFVTDTFEIFDFNSGATVYFLHIFNIVP